MHMHLLSFLHRLRFETRLRRKGASCIRTPISSPTNISATGLEIDGGGLCNLSTLSALREATATLQEHVQSPVNQYPAKALCLNKFAQGRASIGLTLGSPSRTITWHNGASSFITRKTLHKSSVTALACGIRNVLKVDMLHTLHLHVAAPIQRAGPLP
ncbi:hypothetical protein BCR34DRAFT_162898 [Clohesyomyces aquaticus]|uniref:Uncharacterized protein n=1 Tax=Clohesyomyces aquaticus TaxID=1231657 RepID=A0A1Y2A090_9PLEO|nr:hypothetical protein BCR34DRAFT_162898 [Clohesyomyces aquaticus]